MPSCPACGRTASGRYCSACGSPLAAHTCVECDAPLEPDARFCNQCGTPVGGRAAPRADHPAAAASSTDSKLPWLIAGAAFVLLLAIVLVRGRGGPTPESSPPFTSMPGTAAGSRAPDISSLSPRERADRLYDRVMRYAEQGQTDSLRFFAPMAMSAFEMVQPLDAHVRYDLGRVAEVAGQEPVARAQADTILAAEPNHLLGLTLASTAARMRDDAAAFRTFDRRLLAAETSERRRAVDEYQRHARDIDMALDRARRQN